VQPAAVESLEPRAQPAGERSRTKRRPIANAVTEPIPAAVETSSSKRELLAASTGASASASADDDTDDDAIVDVRED
jgi:hypothetical protein